MIRDLTGVDCRKGLFGISLLKDEVFMVTDPSTDKGVGLRARAHLTGCFAKDKCTGC